MRFWLWLALFPVSVLAAPGDAVFPLPGTYHYGHRFELLQAIRYEVVYYFTDEGKARLAELRKQAYQCENTGREIYRCFKAEARKDVPGLNDEVEKNLSQAEMTFGEIRGPAEKLRKGETVTEWTMPQSVDFKGKHYDSYRFFLSADGLQRIFLGEPGEEAILMEADGSLRYSLDLPIRENRKVSYRYIGLAGFTQ